MVPLDISKMELPGKIDAPEDVSYLSSFPFQFNPMYRMVHWSAVCDHGQLVCWPH